jgi:hypothetical protein
MATITDFEGWLDQGEPEGYEEVYSLYRCVQDEEDFGIYECKSKDGKLFIKAGHTDDTLMLASEKAKTAFLKIIETRYVDDNDMDIESWYAYNHAMSKDD